MNMAQEQKDNNRRELGVLLAVVAALALVVAAGTFAFLRFYDSYIDGVLYHERLNQMQEVTSQLFTGLEDVVQSKWNDVEVMTAYLERGKPQDADTLFTFMRKQAELNGLEEENANLVAVDSMGRYLTENGWQGTLDEMDLLLDEPERVNFVSKSLTTDETKMYFLMHLSEPVTVTGDSGTATLIYYGFAQDMEQLNEYFSCDAYGNNNSVYVLNENGMRRFHGKGNNLIEGYNVYAVLESMEYLHGHSFDDARAELETNGHGYANAILDGEEYYYAIYKMHSASWTLLFLVPSACVAENVVGMVNTTVRMILVFALVMVVLTTLIIFVLLKFQQRKSLAVERRNNEILSDALQKTEQAEQAASKANMAKSDFLANMSHDIRTPMNAIVGITKLMAHDRNDPEKMDAYIRKVQSSSQHLLSLINDVLDMSKIESSEVSLSHEPVSLAEQVGQVDSIIRTQTEARGQDFTIRVHEISHEYLVGDAVRLRQIFINLLSNAVKYTPYGGDVTMDLTERPGPDDLHVVIEIAVSDTGCGMTKEFAKHVFEPFTRAENSVTNRVQGTGLGMAIVKRIVDLMGGTVSVESELGKGSCFTVTLPMMIDTRFKHEINAKSVMLITQEEMLAKNARASFSETDVEFRTAKNGEEAVKMLREKPADTILLSGYLDGTRLSDTVSLLKSEARDAVLVFCVDYAQQEKVSKLISKSGVNGFIARPFFLSNFARIVNQARGDDVAAVIEEDGTVLSGLRFLCAEDNSLNAEILSALMDMNGASCVIYPDGRRLLEAFEKVKPGDFDAILMDVQMPVMNGLEATREIRKGKNPLGRTIPIIAMTANAFSSDVQECLDAGMDAHVSKPIDIGMLEHTLRALRNRTVAGGGDTCSPPGDMNPPERNNEGGQA